MRKCFRETTIQSGFTRKLQLAFGVMLLTTLALAWYFYDSARWFSADTRQLARASAELAEYESIARLTWQALQDMEQAVRTGQTIAGPGGAAANDAVGESFTRLRLGLESEPLGPAGAASADWLAELESATDEIFRTVLVVESALLSEQEGVVGQELARLDTAGTVSRFRSLIDAALEQRRMVLTELGSEAVSLANYVVRLLPLIMLLLVIATALVAWRFSRALSGSLGTLQAAASELAKGNLKHRVPDLDEQEFQRLGNAFNEMTAKLDEKERQQRESNVGLEATVEERTRALTESNEKLALVDEHRRKLLAEISHEFRTPLTVIRGESEIALRGKNKDPEAYQDAFRRIIDTTDHATGLVEDLLFIVRADAGEPRLQFQDIEMVALLRTVCAEFAGKATAKELEIEFNTTVEQLTLTGDPRRLRQVFAILLDNALRYSRPGGVIELTLDADLDEVHLAVKDQGIGLNEDEAAQAFERFFRGRQAQSHADQGSGLGLPVAKAIVQAHGGRIALVAREGGGAIASVSLPLKFASGDEPTS